MRMMLARQVISHYLNIIVALIQVQRFCIGVKTILLHTELYWVGYWAQEVCSVAGIICLVTCNIHGWIFASVFVFFKTFYWHRANLKLVGSLPLQGSRPIEGGGGTTLSIWQVWHGFLGWLAVWLVYRAPHCSVRGWLVHHSSVSGCCSFISAIFWATKKPLFNDLVCLVLLMPATVKQPK